MGADDINIYLTNTLLKGLQNMYSESLTLWHQSVVIWAKKQTHIYI